MSRGKLEQRLVALRDDACRLIHRLFKELPRKMIA